MTKKEKLFQKINLNERNLSIILGVLTVAVVGGLFFNYFRGKTKRLTSLPREKEKREETGTVQEKSKEKTSPSVYRVEKGDSLWKIAERFYRSGYNWVDIARENKLRNPNLIYSGEELRIPQVKPKKTTVVITQKKGSSTISGKKYTVQKGDWLSKIALRAYGDMFAWEKIYQANKKVIGPNPNLIKPGQRLTIP